jgi:hypothetical protein
MQDTNNLFCISRVPLDTKKILSEDFPEATDNKGVIQGDNIKWFTLYTDKYYLYIV